DLIAATYWHDGTYNSDKGNVNWKNRKQVTTCDLGMPDLNSENEYVQKVVADYISELKDLGVDGIRWDAAKHIGLPSEDCNFWPAVTAAGLYNYGEILTGPVDSGGETEMKEYTNYMSVTDSAYGSSLLYSFNSGKAPTSAGNWSNRGISTDKLVYWGESHDTYANEEGKESNAVSQNVVDRAYAVAAAREGATALYLSRPEAKARDSIRIGVKGSLHFTSDEIAAVNHFHNAMNGKADHYAVSDNAAVVTRKDGGAVIVLGSGGNKEVSVANTESDVKPGTYKDEVTGNEFVVTETTIKGTVGESGIAVVYDSAFTSRVAASVETGTKFEGDTLKVTLKALDVTEASYTTSEGASGTFKNGDVIEIGGKTNGGDDVTLTLTAKNNKGETVTAAYTYKKAEVKVYPTLTKGGVIFDNSETNWDKVNIYVYDEITKKPTTITNGDWPGVAMTNCGNGLYKYELPDKFDECSHIMVIFNNSPNNDQIPGAMQAGLTMGYNGRKLYDGTKWVSLEGDTNDIYAKSVSLSKSSVSVEKGKSVTVTATVLPSTATDKKVTWSTSNSKIATVSGGKITGVAAGTATITAKTANGKKATCKVTVKNLPTSIKLNKTSATIGKGKTLTLKATIAPAKNTITTTTWKSSNTKIATVSSTGKITAKAVGTTTITATTTNNKTATCKITVKNLPTSIKLNKTSVTIGKGKTLTVKATVTPTKDTITSVTWTSSNTKIATVNSKGKITAKAVGTATITAKNANGKTAKVKVTVKHLPTKVKLNKTTVTLKKGKSVTLKATVTPTAKTITTLSWSTSNKKIATVNKNCKVTAKATGTVTITVKTVNGKTAKCKIKVTK
ncbi:MAG: Ig-like domain-containing protein, partial [Clostridia bacterium]|nr:Ig-like domain-containing protein [Clostridia bacterium]